MLAYRSSIHESTRETPSFMMSGGEHLLPVDLIYGRILDLKVMYDYVQDLMTKLWNVHESARENSSNASDCQKRNYDLKTTDQTFSQGDGILLFNSAKFKGRSQKHSCKWEGPYTIVGKISDPVFEIKSSSTAKPKIVHVYRLKPFVGKMRR